MSDTNHKGAAPVDCNPEKQSLTICELSRVLVGLTAAEMLKLGQARGIITAGCDSVGALSGIRQWKRTQQAKRRMQRGANADILREIWVVLKWIPHVTMAWLKVKANLKHPPESVHKILNEKIDSLAKSVHQNHMWQARQ